MKNLTKIETTGKYVWNSHSGYFISPEKFLKECQPKIYSSNLEDSVKTQFNKLGKVSFNMGQCNQTFYFEDKIQVKSVASKLKLRTSFNEIGEVKYEDNDNYYVKVPKKVGLQRFLKKFAKIV